MALDLREFGSKLIRYREQLKLLAAEVAASTGIEEQRLVELEAGAKAPSGDEVLILADYYRCDYRFFISNERLAPFEQTDSLYRRFGEDFSKEDRWRVQEFLFLCECEQFLVESLDRKYAKFAFAPKGTYFKAHGEAAAVSLRKHLGYEANAVAGDVYSDFRKIGLHLFRRQLVNSNISGVMIRHPYAGACVLVNYAEDIYRQRFTAAHETAHAILDQDEFVVSFTKWERNNLVEIRANTFASRYLLPTALLRTLPQKDWNREDLVQWASRLKVSALTLAIGLKESEIITEEVFSSLSSVRVPAHLKSDPELASLDGRSLKRKRSLLERGLSTAYVSLCFDALAEGVVTNARAAEMLLVSEDELLEMSRLFQVNLFAHD
jgi:Zn-dependent peptidase ImmA (M78 family)